MRRSDYLDYIKRAADEGWKEYPGVIERWRNSPKHHELWGYDAPGHPIYLADLLAFLYQETKDKTYAERAREILAGYGDLRDTYPKELQATRVEYRDGVPAISNFFIMPPYARAYLRIRTSGVIDAKTREKIERDLAFSLDHIFHFPEWGAHNRAMLRAESLYYGAVALAHHPSAGKWKQLAETLAADSIRQWEIEDATGYHGVWLYSLFSYADVSGQPEILQSIQVRYYMDYFTQLLTPHGNIADFGDAHWNGGWERFVPVFEKAATLYRNPNYKYVAEQLTRRAVERIARSANSSQPSLATVYVGTAVGSAFTDAFRWTDDSVKSQPPATLSQDVLDDLVGKKVVFRDGWEPASTMLLVNYRDEGDGGWLGRDYLRQNLSVEEEKMHHGHADENSIALLMSGRSVLLHDGGYRPDLPSGPNGEWRADYFHNRVVARKDKRAKDQGIFEFIRNSGAYRRVTTQKIDFLKFKDVEVSRTRLTDADLGYQWDRIITWIRSKDMFVVVDGVKALRSDYFTFTNLWHTRTILSQDKQSFDTFYDQIQTDRLANNKALLIHFPESDFGKQIGTYKETRHFQDETAIYQTMSSFYNTGDMEFFITILQLHDQTPAQAEVARSSLRRIHVLPVDKPGRAVGVSIVDADSTAALLVKLDLDMDLARENIRPRYGFQRGKVTYGEFTTDAAFLYAAIGGGQIAYAASNLTRAIYRNRTLLEALPNTFPLQLDGSPPRPGYARWRFWEDVVKLAN
ncbi:MAG TPA: hypothetical protein VGK99_03125 [Acidobacteriota bacterium]|jgi:hypothetical protein